MTKRKTKDTDIVEIEMVLDRSGSMDVIRNDAIGGFNTWLDEQQKLPGEANLTLTLFDHERLVTGPRPIKEQSPLTNETYQPRGSTALNDAVGAAIQRLNTKNPKRAILVILTDGQENASKEYTTEQVKQLVTQAQSKGWQVMYLSADLNAFANAASIGVLKGNTVQYAANSGTAFRGTLSATSAVNAAYRVANAPDMTSTLQPPGDNTENQSN